MLRQPELHFEMVFENLEIDLRLVEWGVEQIVCVNLPASSALRLTDA